MRSLKVSAGRVLLHRRGCISCHRLAPDVALPEGPRLDLVSLKLDPQWLLAWLQNPTAYDRSTPMPKVSRSLEELQLMVAFLLGLPADLELLPLPDFEPDPYRGSRLFQELSCRDCHLVAGEGGRRGPALDHIGTKTSAHWLYSFLATPRRFQPGSTSHDFGLSLRDALDLSAFQSLRFGGGGYERVANEDDLDGHAAREPASAVHRRGFAAFVDAGCLTCHVVAQYLGAPIEPGLDLAAATAAARFHRARRGSIPPISLDDDGVVAVAAALVSLDDSAATATARRLPDNFWDLPIPAQGDPPALVSEDARELKPAACGTCHIRQYLEWSGSSHAGALSAGLWSHLVDYVDESPEFVRDCMTCHAPMLEQYTRQSASPLVLDGTEVGVSCSGCHVREHRYFGPGPRPGSSERLVSGFTGGHHGGSEASAAFLDSDFCAPCHQFSDDGLALGGKLLQNTHREWEESVYRARGETCQSCHMPDGSHRWRGIRDREQVAEALHMTVDWQTSQQSAQEIDVEVRLQNRGAGHHLPTYATPALLVKTFLSDDAGSVLDNSLETRIVHRRLLLEQEAELYDTRIPAGGTWVFNATLARPPEAAFINVYVEVDPDFFYRSFFDRLEGRSRTSTLLVQRARADIAESAYILFARHLALE